MYRKLKLLDTVRVPPEKLDEDTGKVVKKMLEQKLEGKINKDLGMFIAVTEVEDVREGKLIPGDAGVYYNAEFECISYKPIMQEIVEGEVVEVVDFGAFIGLGPMDALLHVSQITDDYVSHNEKSARLVGKETNFSLAEGDYVRARIIAVSLNEQEPGESKVGLTMRQPALQKIGEEEEEEYGGKVIIREMDDADEEESEIDEEKDDEEDEDEVVVCRECGNEYKAITASHLRTHDMDMDEYREKYPEAKTRKGE